SHGRGRTRGHGGTVRRVCFRRAGPKDRAAVPAGWSKETHRSMADPMSDVPRMMRDILDQPHSLKQVLDHQFGPGAHALEQAADTIRSVPTIIVSGMGASLYGAMPLAYQLNSIGRACQVVGAGELLHFGGDLP